jgi:hypothetical protein
MNRKDIICGWGKQYPNQHFTNCLGILHLSSDNTALSSDRLMLGEGGFWTRAALILSTDRIIRYIQQSSTNKTMTPATFADLIEAAEQLPLEEQEDLIHILKNRLRDLKRAELVKAVAEAQQEFAQGKCKPMTPAQIIEEILS